MGTRVTRAVEHLSVDAVLERIQAERRPWRRQRWEIIYQALTAPRKAEGIARAVGVSSATVHRVIATYNQVGVAAIETPGKGGRRHQYLTPWSKNVPSSSRSRLVLPAERSRRLERSSSPWKPKLDKRSTKAPSIAYWTDMAGDNCPSLPVWLRGKRKPMRDQTQFLHWNGESSCLALGSRATSSPSSAIPAI